MDDALTMSEIGIVVIGRNEGARLMRCFESIAPNYPVVYVDSGSTDASVDVAATHLAQVVELDMQIPFTAARARNAGLAALANHCAFVQFVDGDCTLQPGWLEVARASLNDDEGLAAVFGRRREINPSASLYNWLCDVEWAVAPGPARYFGGDVMIRRSALEQTGGYPADMIAGEEPDLAIRLRKRGWKLLCLPHEMTLHDANIKVFGQWWRRTVRSGHAYAELAFRHRAEPSSDYRRRLVSVALWGGAVPVVVILLVLLAIALGRSDLALAGTIVMLMPLIQVARLAVREAPRHGWQRATCVAAYLMLSKPAQMIGVAKFWTAALAGKRSRLIEYKGNPA